jgi:hypothetical protein
MIETFTGNQLTVGEIVKNINHPRNALHLQSDAHGWFSELKWGIEAITLGDGKVSINLQTIQGLNSECDRLNTDIGSCLISDLHSYIETMGIK